jgi:hypothetical protein
MRFSILLLFQNIPTVSQMYNREQTNKFQTVMCQQETRVLQPPVRFLPGLSAEFNSDYYCFCVCASTQSNGPSRATSKETTCLVIGWANRNFILQERLSFLIVMEFINMLISTYWFAE